MKICKNCTLNDNIFNVSINDEGFCNQCQKYFETNSNISEDEYKNKDKQFIDACDQYRHLPYQILLAYSGGKDSSYTLYLLRKKYNLSVLAVTYDNGFLTEQCRQNIHEVTASLNVDSITLKPSFANLAGVFGFAGSNEIFPKKSLERASSICTACIGMVKPSIFREAIIRKIPFVSFGWTPGQVNLKASIVKLDYKMILANQKQIKEPIIKRFGKEFEKYFMDAQWLENHKDNIPCLAYPLVFSNYDEKEIVKTIESIGWKKPKDTDMNSTNCLLNSYANFIHSSKYGYNPYCLEIANLVRAGLLSREEGLNKISNSGSDMVIKYVKEQLEKYSAG